jgi:hypothetical protein
MTSMASCAINWSSKNQRSSKSSVRMISSNHPKTRDDDTLIPIGTVAPAPQSHSRHLGFDNRYWPLVLLLIVLVFFEGKGEAALRPIPASYPIHLGGPTREWSYFQGRTPFGAELRLKFNSNANSREQTLFIRQEDVKQDWTVTLNGKKLGSLFLMEADVMHTLAIPASVLREGENELQIASKAADDILIHSLAIADDTKTNLLTAGPLMIAVKDSTGASIPARITIVDANGSLAAIHGLAGNGQNSQSISNNAIRPGVIYTATGAARVGLLPGKYTVYATRGLEYSLAKSEVALDSAAQSISLSLSREVNTRGWFASDTHIHTFSLSKHGDALLHERAITLAGEGIELPIVTEHNLHADYSDAASDLGLSRYFTVVPGNEVTTTNGHFNIFPVSPSAKAIDHTKVYWPDLLERIRQSPGVRVAILNHPTDTHAGFTPFAATNFNRITGKNLRGNFEFTFDAVELINSGAMRTDWMEPIRTWFALLNRGYRITGVGSSDSHDVSRFVVGQGRTYIQGDDSTPGKIDVQKACAALKDGKAIVSLGLFPQLRVSDAPDALDAPQLTTGILPAVGSGVGELHTGKSKFFEVTASVDFPRWMNPQGRTTATLFANGRPLLVFPFELAKIAGKPFAFKARFPKPKADTWYVLVADLPGVTNAYWSIARPYQPSSPEWNPAMIGVTNPVWLDADGDGRFTPPRMVAKGIVETTATPQKILATLRAYDWAVAVHAAELLQESGTDLKSESFQEELKSATPKVQQAFADYIKTISPQ